MAESDLLQLFLQLAGRLDGLLFLLPVRLQPGLLFLQVGQLLFEPAEAFDRRRVLLLAKRLALDLELHDPPTHLVELGRHGIDLHAQLRGGFVDEVDRLVRQKPVGDVAMRQDCGRHERGVLERDAVMDLVPVAKTAQNRDGVLDGRFAHQDGLKTTLERGILLDVLPVFVECRRADRVQFAARQHRLQHLRGIHRAFGGAGADHGVKLVDEEDDLTLGVGDLLEDGLEALLELAAILGARHQRTHVEREDLLVLESFRHVATDDALRQPFDDGRLADAGLADEHRIVLGTPGQHLDHAPHFLVAADDRIELALAGQLRQIAAVAGERLVGRLRVLRCDALVAAHLRERPVERVLGRTVALQELGGGRAPRLGGQCQRAGVRC